MIQCQSLLKEINTHDGDKNFLSQPVGRHKDRGLGECGFEHLQGVSPSTTRMALNTHLWGGVMDSTMVLLDTGSRRQEIP